MRRWAGALDLAAVVVFVSIGRAVHAHGDSLRGIASTAWPFVVGWAAGWGLLLRRRRSGLAPSDGAVVAVVTTAVGMVLRVVGSQGIAAAFVAVAVGFLGAVMTGWRLVALAVRRHRRPAA